MAKENAMQRISPEAHQKSRHVAPLAFRVPGPNPNRGERERGRRTRLLHRIPLAIASSSAELLQFRVSNGRQFLDFHSLQATSGPGGGGRGASAGQRERGITVEDFKLIKMQMANYIWKLAQSVKVRQRVIATAVTYMRRVYTRKSMSEYDPRLVAPACLYLAAKAEESTVQAKALAFYIRKIYSDEKYRYEVKDILEMEMKILEALNYYLVVFHPYHSLTHLLQDAGMEDMTQFTWGLVNDTYKMDLILVHPPHLIALACIYIASVYKDRDTTSWFEELRVDMNVVKNIAVEILDFYENRISISEERVHAALNKLAMKP
ncbi:hypothetical protein ACJRO7_030146 [Eucalyptus globulus]|uniref:Cyclin-like domain-containing protein n=1 Tax=Eucalyptus globulus TaxID=34317 RepID=A0ABD3JDH8_EUCGL